MIDHGRNRPRRGGALLAMLATAGVAIMLVPAGTHADGNKFQWSKNGNKAEVFWRSFLDDAAYMTVSSTARQRRGSRAMYVRVDFYALRCAAGMNTCYSIGAGGVVSLGEGAEWHRIARQRHPDMPRKRSKRFTASEALDPDSTLMQVRVHLCYDRNITPDPCSKPRYGTLKYNSG